MQINNTYRVVLALLFWVGNGKLYAQQKITTGVLVINAGTGGSSAGIQSARMGVNTIITEPGTWMGGMLSAAGVAAFDGNHQLPSGIWAEFREQLYKVYGGPAKVATGWVSNTLFEPHVGDSILKAMAAREKKLGVLYQHHFIRVIKNGNQVKGAVFYRGISKDTLFIYAHQVIDGTELGDVMANAGISFDVGMEASATTGEGVNVPATNNIVQDLTYAAIVKDYGAAADCTIVKPAHYSPAEFDGACTDYYIDNSRPAPAVDAKKMLDYGKLPNKKYMLNWPTYGNDIYLNIIHLDEKERAIELIKAKEQTRRFLYFIQTQLGYKNLGMADDEFPTADRFPMMAYHREGRRVKGLVRFSLQHIADPYHQPLPLYRTGIAVGDYPIDHHHKKNPAAPQHLDFFPIPSFNVPLGALIPQQYQGIIIAEKGISVSNVVNGTTRLQPCVMLIGQAAGALAALCVQQRKQAAAIAVRDVQAVLIGSNAYIMPYVDVKTANPFFASIQRIGATGILKGKGEPNAWANRTWFYPDSLVSMDTLAKNIAPFIAVGEGSLQNTHLTIEGAVAMLQQFAIAFPSQLTALTKQLKTNTYRSTALTSSWKKWGLKNFDLNRPITRTELAVMLDKTVNPFLLKPVDHSGNF